MKVYKLLNRNVAIGVELIGLLAFAWAIPFFPLKISGNIGAAFVVATISVIAASIISAVALFIFDFRPGWLFMLFRLMFEPRGHYNLVDKDAKFISYEDRKNGKN